MHRFTATTGSKYATYPGQFHDRFIHRWVSVFAWASQSFLITALPLKPDSPLQHEICWDIFPPQITVYCRGEITIAASETSTWKAFFFITDGLWIIFFLPLPASTVFCKVPERLNTVFVVVHNGFRWGPGTLRGAVIGILSDSTAIKQ